MTLRKRQFFAWYFIGVAILCAVYALMPLVPEVAWKIGEARAAVEVKAFERAASRFRVEQVAFTSRDVQRLPTVVNGVISRSLQMNGVSSQQTRNVDPSVEALLNTVSIPDAIREETAVLKDYSSSVIEKYHSVVPDLPAVSKMKQPARSNHTDTKQQLSGIKIALAAEQPKKQSSKPAAQAASKKPRGNSIIISSIKVDMPVLAGDEKVLDRGAWLLPGSAILGEGNTVISAHRYQSFGSKSFYHLDKVHEDDVISVWWNGKEYQYRVTSNFVVKPDHVDVLNKSSTPKLTLITCDPVFSTEKRRIVIAELIES